MAMTPDSAQPDDADAGGQAAPDDQGSAQGYCIELHVAANGSITGNVEPESEEASEEGGEADGGSSAPEGEPLKNIKAALTWALDVYRNNGQEPGDADASFQQGFSGSQGSGS